MAEEGSTAQVHPQKLTQALLHAAQAKGAKLVRGAVQGVNLSKDGTSVEGKVSLALLTQLYKLRYTLFYGALCLPVLSCEHPQTLHARVGEG